VEKYGTACLFVNGSPDAAVVYLFTATRIVIAGDVLGLYGAAIHH
jgi:hypothetical protein